MELLGDLGHVELTSFHLEIVLVSVQERCTVCVERTRVGNHFGRTRWNSYVTWVMWNLTSFRLETALASVQDGAWFALDVPQAHKLFWTHLMYH